MQLSPIEWTHFTSNPLKYRDPDGNVVWACVHASEGCRKCYSEALTKRYGKGKAFTAPNMESLTPFLDDKELRHMLTYKPASGKRCFVGDMTDIFGEWVPDELLEELFSVFALRSDVTWQILTKRADRMRRFLRDDDDDGLARWAVIEGGAQRRHHERTGEDPSQWLAVHGPLPNVWLGVSVEDQKTADQRIPLLLQTPAAVRFISAEPLLDFVNICRWIPADWSPALNEWTKAPHKGPALDWVIVGGESGPKSRPFRPHWARQIVGPCKAAGVPVFVKQLGAQVQERNDRIADEWYYADGSDMDSAAIDGDSYRYQGAPVRLLLKDRKGGNPEEWPADLRCRQFPEPRNPQPPTVETRL